MKFFFLIQRDSAAKQ